MIKIIKSWFLNFVFISTILTTFILFPLEAVEIIEVDSTLIKEALKDGSLFPSVSLIPGEITNIKVPRANEVVLVIKNNFPARELQLKAIIEIDGQIAGTKNFKIPPQTKIPVLYKLSQNLLGKHQVKGVVHFTKPDNLSGREQVYDFSQKELSKNFDMTKIIKIPYVTSKVNIDGDISKWEKIEPMVLNTKESVAPVKAAENWQGPEDLSAKIYLAWNDTNFYLALEVQDNKHFNNKIGGDLWNGDCIQFAIIPIILEELPPFNLGLAFASLAVRTTKWGGEDTNLFNKSRYIVKRDEEHKKTFYEMEIPFEALKMEGKKGALFDFNICILDDDDGSGQKYWMQLTPGLAGGWNAENFKRFTLWK